MNSKKMAALGLFLLFAPVSNASQELLPLDSIYINSVEKFYRQAEESKDDIWNGMVMAPVCLFRTGGPALLYNHPDPPEGFEKIGHRLYLGSQAELQLFGATQATINGTLTAIVDYSRPDYSCSEEVYAELFHELHHVYQQNHIKHIGFDNPAILLTYPEDEGNDALKLYEQRILYRMCFEDDSRNFKKLLNQFYSCRLKRKNIIGSYAGYEEAVENMEGPAFFCEYRFYAAYQEAGSATGDNYIQKHFFGLLTTPYYGRKSLRQRHLVAGMAMCYILDKYFEGWQKEYYSKSGSLYDYFISKFSPTSEEIKIDPIYFAMSNLHTAEAVRNHQLAYDSFNAQPGIRITLEFTSRPQFRGFDPMNAEAINDSIILHTTLLKLSGGDDNMLFINNNKAITVVDGEIWNARKVILYEKDNEIRLEENRIIIDSEGKSLTWKGKLIQKSDTEIIFFCD